jgi:hypothetical protein
MLHKMVTILRLFHKDVLQITAHKIDIDGRFKSLRDPFTLSSTAATFMRLFVREMSTPSVR